jgi:hypothetical protein
MKGKTEVRLVMVTVYAIMTITKLFASAILGSLMMGTTNALSVLTGTSTIHSALTPLLILLKIV